jgi:LEA14-like dessication related protein
MKTLSAIFILFFFCRCSKPETPTYLGYEDFRVAQLGIKNTVLTTKVKLYNPNAYALKLRSASIDVYLNNNFFGHSTLDSLITLPGRDTTYVPLSLSASSKDILGNAVKVWLNPDVKVKITGTAKAGRGSLFINVPINYEGVQRLEF